MAGLDRGCRDQAGIVSRMRWVNVKSLALCTFDCGYTIYMYVMCMCMYVCVCHC